MAEDRTIRIRIEPFADTRGLADLEVRATAAATALGTLGKQAADAYQRVQALGQLGRTPDERRQEQATEREARRRLGLRCCLTDRQPHRGARCPAARPCPVLCRRDNRCIRVSAGGEMYQNRQCGNGTFFWQHMCRGFCTWDSPPMKIA